MGLNLASVVGMGIDGWLLIIDGSCSLSLVRAGAGWRKRREGKKEGSMEPAGKTPCLDKVSVIGYKSGGAHRHGGFSGAGPGLRHSKPWNGPLKRRQSSGRQTRTGRNSGMELGQWRSNHRLLEITSLT